MRLFAGSQGRVEGDEGTRFNSSPVNQTPAEPPPSYETAIGLNSLPLCQLETENPSNAGTGMVSRSSRRTHEPPGYHSSTESGNRQTVTRVASTSPAGGHLHHGCSSLTEALSKAALAGKRNTVRTLLEAGASIFESSPSGTISAVHDALRGPEPELALLLLDYPCERAYQGELTTLDGEAKVRSLLSLEDKNGCTPLHLAASVGAADVVREMVELGAFVDASDKFGRTPLHMAARYNRVDAMGVLLEHGADAKLVRAGLWQAATPTAQRELGDCAFVMRTVAKAVSQRQSVKAEDPQVGLSLAKEQSARADHGAPLVTSGLHEASSLSVRDKAPPQRSAATPSSIGGSGASIQPWNIQNTGGLFSRNHKGSTPRPAGFCTTLTNSTGRRARRLPDVSIYSPEYDSWRKMCETVQAEHRRQKERNAEAGYEAC